MRESEEALLNSFPCPSLFPVSILQYPFSWREGERERPLPPASVSLFFSFAKEWKGERRRHAWGEDIDGLLASMAAASWFLSPSSLHSHSRWERERRGSLSESEGTDRAKEIEKEIEKERGQEMLSGKKEIARVGRSGEDPTAGQVGTQLPVGEKE